MRLFDTYTRALVELPPPPGPIRIYVCGPTVYQRIHIGNARPFVLSMWLKRWLEESGYEVRLAEKASSSKIRQFDHLPNFIVWDRDRVVLPGHCENARDCVRLGGLDGKGGPEFFGFSRSCFDKRNALARKRCCGGEECDNREGRECPVELGGRLREVSGAQPDQLCKMAVRVGEKLQREVWMLQGFQCGCFSQAAAEVKRPKGFKRELAGIGTDHVAQ